MTRFTRLPALFMLCLLPFAVYSQRMTVTHKVSTVQPELYPVPGSHLLEQENKKVREYVALHPEALVRSSLQKTTAWNFSVGDTRTWKSQNIKTGVFYDVPSTCRAVGTHCYMFVEDEVWGAGVTQDAVNAVMDAFDNQTPANATKGVYQMDVETFGAPPDVDNDSKIVILILDIQDGNTGSGPFVAGYFWGGNEVINYPNGNNAEIYYVDSYPLDLSTPSGVTQGMSTAAHEFQHMIHFGKDSQEETFINEGCSCFAQSYCGYGIRDQNGYVNETNRALMDWRATSDPLVVNDYSRAGRFFQYFGDQFGEGVFMPIVASQQQGINGLNAGLTSYGAGRQFAEIFQDWLVANILDDRTVDPHYGYIYPDLLKAVGTDHVNPNVSLTQSSIYSLAAEYISYVSGSDLRITFSSSSSAIVVKAVEIGFPSRVLDVTPGVEFHEPGFGSTYSAIHFVVMNTSQTTSANYSYQSSGTVNASAIELKYDTSDPVGYLPLQEGDSVCVWFDAMAGTRLDSIKVALSKTGSMTGGVYAFTGKQNPTPLGTRLAPIVATRTDPTSRWVSVDVRSYGISAGSDFAVAFACVGAASTDPRVMVSDEPKSSVGFHSYSYYAEASPDWYILQSSADSAYAYTIRAYVSILSTGVSDPVQLPVVTGLDQNYPNPFNPSTSIKYTVGGKRGQGSGGSDVSLVVYDVLGRQVAVLVQERKEPGNYEVNFDARALASGIYICQMKAGSFVQARKMLLAK
jgi:hypothetical protein